MNIGKLNKKNKGYVQHFAESLLKSNGNRYDIIAIETFSGSKSYSVEDLAKDALYYNEGINMKKYKFMDLLGENNFSFKKIHNDKNSFYNNPGMYGETLAKNMVNAIEALAKKYIKSKMQK
jgi:hypothetical protein